MTDPSMNDISYIDVGTRETSPHMHAHSGSRRDPDSTHSTRKDTWYCNCHPPPTLHHDWVNMAEVQLQIATYKHTPAARVRNLCAWPMLPYRFGVPVCSAPVTARAGSDSGAPRPLTGLVLCSSDCVLHMSRPIRF